MGRGLRRIEADRGARALPSRADGGDDQPHGGRRRARLRRRRVADGARHGAPARHRVARRPACSSPRARPSRGARSRHGDRGGGRKELYFVGGQAAPRRVEQRERAAGRVPRPARASSRATSSTSRSPSCPATAAAWATRSSRSASSASLDIFRAIRDQGRDRLVDLFPWRDGQLTFYADQTAPHVEFPLDLELPALILAGVEAAEPGERRSRRAWRDRLDDVVAPAHRRPRPASSPRRGPPLAAARARLRARSRAACARCSPPSPRDPATTAAATPFAPSTSSSTAKLLSRQ